MDESYRAGADEGEEFEKQAMERWSVGKLQNTLKNAISAGMILSGEKI